MFSNAIGYLLDKIEQMRKDCSRGKNSNCKAIRPKSWKWKRDFVFLLFRCFQYIELHQREIVKLVGSLTRLVLIFVILNCNNFCDRETWTVNLQKVRRYSVLFVTFHEQLLLEHRVGNFVERETTKRIHRQLERDRNLANFPVSRPLWWSPSRYPSQTADT